MDLVYMLKVQNFNHDLKFSLRSVEKYVKGYDNIWIVGYKPYWVQNVQYLKIPQDGPKYKNSLKNVLSMCMNEMISDDFVLMNDDFIAHKPVNINTDLNLCLKTLDEKIDRFKNVNPSDWRIGFQTIKTVLEKIGSKHFMDFEVHAPMVFNKKKFIDMFKYKEVQEIVKSPKVLHYRTLYGNLYYNNPKSIKDVKIPFKTDLTDEFLEIDNWISVYDGVIENKKYPKLMEFLKQFKQSKYEKFSI